MILLGWAVAFAGGVLETEAVSARTDAVALQQHAEGLGYSARVVRRYRQGAGWEFVVQVDVPDEAPADEAATRLQEAAGVAVEVLTGVERSPVVAPVEAPPVDEVLERAARAHGGGDTASVLTAAESVRFRYHRVLDVEGEALSSTGTWLRRGTDLRLELRVQDGPGVSSVVVVVGDDAWVATTEAAVERDAGLARELVGRHGPNELLALAFALPQLLSEAAADPATWRDGEATPSHVTLEQLGADGDVATRIWFDATTWWVQALEIRDDAGVSTVTLADWREVSAGLVVPFELERRRDDIRIDAVEVLELGLDAAVDSAFFAPPDRLAASP